MVESAKKEFLTPTLKEAESYRGKLRPEAALDYFGVQDATRKEMREKIAEVVTGDTQAKIEEITGAVRAELLALLSYLRILDEKIKKIQIFENVYAEKFQKEKESPPELELTVEPPDKLLSQLKIFQTSSKETEKAEAKFDLEKNRARICRIAKALKIPLQPMSVDNLEKFNFSEEDEKRDGGPNDKRDETQSVGKRRAEEVSKFDATMWDFYFQFEKKKKESEERKKKEKINQRPLSPLISLYFCIRQEWNEEGLEGRELEELSVYNLVHFLVSLRSRDFLAQGDRGLINRIQKLASESVDSFLTRFPFVRGLSTDSKERAIEEKLKGVPVELLIWLGEALKEGKFRETDLSPLQSFVRHLEDQIVWQLTEEMLEGKEKIHLRLDPIFRHRLYEPVEKWQKEPHKSLRKLVEYEPVKSEAKEVRESKVAKAGKVFGTFALIGTTLTEFWNNVAEIFTRVRGKASAQSATPKVEPKGERKP